MQKHQPSIPPAELPGLLAAIQGYDGDAVSRLGLQFLALTFVRTAELIGATWPEFDETSGLWIIPAARMKMKREHLVPLSRQTLALLTQLRNLNGDARFVFAGANPRKHISNNTLLYALYRLGYHSRMTPRLRRRRDWHWTATCSRAAAAVALPLSSCPASAEEEIADLIRRAAVKNAAFMRGDMLRWSELARIAPDFTLMQPEAPGGDVAILPKRHDRSGSRCNLCQPGHCGSGHDRAAAR